MTQTANFLPQTTGTLALERVLASLRVSTQLLVNETYRAPWGISVPGAAELAAMLETTTDAHVVPFHLVVRGAFELRLASRQPTLVTAGELAVVTSGAPHRLSEGAPQTVVPLLEAMRGRARGDGQTALVCGAFVMHDTRFNPLFAALPDVMRVAVATPSAGPVGRGIAELLVTEVGRGGAGRPWVVSRLLEVLCAEAIASVEARSLRGPNWLKAMHDTSIAAALDAFHRAPAGHWTVVRLAKRAALSPSRFAARFRELMGESPMAYVAAWRLTIAARLLRDSSQRVDEVGRSVGYESLPAFSRAFKRQWGQSPLAMRRG